MDKMSNNMLEKVTNGKASAKVAAFADYPELQDIKQDFIALRKDTSELAAHLKDDGLAHAQDAKDYVSDRFDRLQDQGRKQIRVLEHRVRSKPLQTLATAFAVGVIAHYFMNRK